MKEDIINKKEKWNMIDKDSICLNCGHTREEHDEFEQSLGNNSHCCLATITEGIATYICDCSRFENDEYDD